MVVAALLLATAAGAQTPETVSFLSEDGKTKLVAYLFKPGTPGPRPAVVMMHGRLGPYSTLAKGVYNVETLSKRHKEWGKFWAERGYIGLHVDSFGPRGYPRGFAAGTYKDRPAELNEITIRPLDAYGALKFLRARPDVIPDRIALHGWSNGGSATLSTMAVNAPGIANPRPTTGFRAALAFYPGCGLHERYRNSYKPYAPVLMFIGTDDEEVSPKSCEQLAGWGKDAGGDIDLISYPGAQHGFDDPGKKRQSSEANRLATIDAKGRAEAFFRRHLLAN